VVLSSSSSDDLLLLMVLVLKLWIKELTLLEVDMVGLGLELLREEIELVVLDLTILSDFMEGFGAIAGFGPILGLGAIAGLNVGVVETEEVFELKPCVGLGDIPGFGLDFGERTGFGLGLGGAGFGLGVDLGVDGAEDFGVVVFEEGFEVVGIAGLGAIAGFCGASADFDTFGFEVGDIVTGEVTKSLEITNGEVVVVLEVVVGLVGDTIVLGFGLGVLGEVELAESGLEKEETNLGLEGVLRCMVLLF